MKRVLPPLLALLATVTSGAQPWSDPDSARFILRNVAEINGAADEYAPCLTPSREWLYFTSSRQGGIAKVHRVPSKGDGWGPPTLVADTTIGDTLGDDGALAMTFPFIAQLFPLGTSDLKDLDFVGVGTFTSGRRANVYADADLFLVRVGLNQVDLAERNPIPAVNGDDWEAQGAITPDGRILVFSSDRSGGFGGMDLWLSIRESDGSYGEPRNLGATVNTEGNEFSPSFAPDGKNLYFASTGHGGLGGSDIYVTKIDTKRGTFMPVRNLGPRINTPLNEGFFFSAGRERCFFASDRIGGKGGLDIYEGTPNIFATSYSTIELSISDTTFDKDLGGRLRIIEPLLGKTVAELTIEPGVPTVIPLPGGTDYEIEALVPGFPPSRVVMNEVPIDTVYQYTVKLGTAPVAPEVVFTIDGVDVPLFVSGYYRVNTRSSLDDLKRRQQGDLRAVTYIQDVVRDTVVYAEYAARAGRVEKILDEFYQRCVDEYFPGYLRVRQPNEKLEVYVYGYADPRPIIGRYREKTVEFYDSLGHRHQVRKGEKLDNFKLAGLRALYAAEYLDNRFRLAAAQGHGEYAQLVADGTLRWIPVSGNVDDYSGGGDLAQKRRIKLLFRRVGDR